MSTNKTDNYHLHLWESTDTFSRPEFNDNFKKVDAAVRAAETKAAGALAEGLSAQAAALSAYQTANDAAVGALAAAVPKIEMGSYVGNGGLGAGAPNTLTFGFVPRLVIIVTDKDYISAQGTVLLQGQRLSAGMGIGYNELSLKLHLTWSGNSVSWYSTNSTATYQLNQADMTYRYLALG